MQAPIKNRKKIALALSGCSGKAIAYIGMLEVFQENNIPVDMIAAISSGALVACSYASGNLAKLKEKYFNITRQEFFDLFEPSFKGGIFTLDRVDDAVTELITVQNLEELQIPVTLVASDIVEGKEVNITMGNILRAIKASCAFPGLFEPIMWGDKVLLDGGLFSIVPIEAAKLMNPDIVIGIDMYTRRNLFENSFLQIRRGYNFLKEPFAMMFNGISRFIKWLRGGEDPQMTISQIKTPSILSVFGKSLDYAIAERKKDEQFNCDLMIYPEVERYGMVDHKNILNVYNEGRRAAELALPKIKELLND